MNVSRQHVAIVGGGVAGCCTALELVKNGKLQISIFEKNSELMRESSDATPGRMGLGFHYADLNTAIFYLNATLEFTKRFSKFRQDVEKCPSHPLRRGRYFIMKKSLSSTKDILKTYDALKAEYAYIVNRDKSYQLFGPPEDFYRVLDPIEYENNVAVDEIDIGIETAEELLNWKLFRIFLIEELHKYKHQIRIFLNTEVNQIKTIRPNAYSILSREKNGCQKITHGDVVINASWYNISKFNSMLGFNDVRTCNRVKAIATVQLPESLVDAPSMFFCMGSFCMFSNKGNGIGMITYAEETNIAVSSSDDFQQEMADIFFNIPDQEKLSKGQRIIDGVSKFIPEMKNATLIKTNYGVIQTLIDNDTIDYGFKIGNLDYIHEPETGGIHKRDHTGVRLLCPGYIVNACMKLLYCTCAHDS